MTVSIPGASKLNLAGILTRRTRSARAEELLPKSATSLKGHEIARLFSSELPKRAPRPAKLNENEKSARDQLSSLRGALYSKD